MQVVGAAFMADVSNSTPLFEKVGEQEAYREISLCLEEIREQVCDLGGDFLHSKGDDVLAFFKNPDAALEAAKATTRRTSEHTLQVHAGLSWGRMLRLPDDIYGKPVNTAARLASLAKSHEVLVHELFFDQLDMSNRKTLREVDTLSLKGLSKRLKVYSHLAENPAEQTMIIANSSSASIRALRLKLIHNSIIKELSEGQEMSLGRSIDVDLIVSQPWVSRQHATVSLMNGIVVLRDHSSLGSFVRLEEGREILARRESVTLIGNGAVSLGVPFTQSRQAVIRYSQTRTLRDTVSGEAIP